MKKMNTCQYYKNIYSQYFQNILIILFFNNIKIKQKQDNYIKIKIKNYKSKKIRQKNSVIVKFLNYDPGYKTEGTIHEKIVMVKIKHKKNNTKKNPKTTAIKIMSVNIAIKNKSKGNNKF